MKTVLNESELNDIVFKVDNRFNPATRYDYMRGAYDYGRRVKPLVWLQSNSEQHFNALDYSIKRFASGKYVGYFQGSHFLEFPDETYLLEAKRFCQKHHNELILGALE